MDNHTTQFVSETGVMKFLPRNNGYLEMNAGTRYTIIFDSNGIWVWDNATSTTSMSVSKVHTVTKTLTSNAYGNFPLGYGPSVLVLSATAITNDFNLVPVLFKNEGWFAYGLLNRPSVTPQYVNEGITTTCKIQYLTL